MSFLDTIIPVIIVVAFVGIIWSRIYNHEKEHIDPLIKKVKGWFTTEDGDDSFGQDDDFELAFRGQM